MQNYNLKTSGTIFSAVVLFVTLPVASNFWGCSHRGDGELNVDRIQGYANAIEKNVRMAKAALRKRDLEEADDSLEQAEEILSDNLQEMDAYPEIDQLERSVSKTKTDVCFGHVSVALDKYFMFINEKDPDEAGEMLQLARKEHKRCRDIISSRPEYLALKMNLDTAPESLRKLKIELARPALLNKIQQAQKPLEDLRHKIVEKLKSLESKPDQRNLAVEIYALIQKLTRELDSSNDFSKDMEWKKYKNELRAEIDSMSAKRQALVRRGKVLMIVHRNLVLAEKHINESLKLRRNEKARSKALLQDARAEFRRCVQILKKETRQEPTLSKYSFRYKGKKRNVAWLIRHLRSRMAAVGTLLKRSAGLKSKKTKARPRRRHRIKRW